MIVWFSITLNSERNCNFCRWSRWYSWVVADRGSICFLAWEYKWLFFLEQTSFYKRTDTIRLNSYSKSDHKTSYSRWTFLAFLTNKRARAIHLPWPHSNHCQLITCLVVGKLKSMASFCLWVPNRECNARVTNYHCCKARWSLILCASSCSSNQAWCSGRHHAD